MDAITTEMKPPAFATLLRTKRRNNSFIDSSELRPSTYFLEVLPVQTRAVWVVTVAVMATSISYAVQ
jgi:hypothetical protein